MNTYSKRINYEKKNIMKKIKKINYSYKNDIINIYNFNNNIFEVFVWDKFRFISILLDFNNVKNIYPFAPPNVIINGLNYLKYLCEKSRKYQNNQIKIMDQLDINDKQFFKLFGNSYCRGCKSILCGKNWNPVKNITNIVDEVVENFNYDNKFICLLFIKKVTQKFTNQNIYQKIYEFI
tara:strand:- start:270 stop:806 length:537 start_codon:yes stop_codon:yes gene_type:complete